MSNRAARRHPERHKVQPQNKPLNGAQTGGVVIAYCHPVGEVNSRFHTSVIDLIVRDAMLGGPITQAGGHLPMSSGANIVTARNKVVKTFLEDTTAEWLWWLDADMTFPPDTLDRLLASADRKQRPIVGGLCFALLKGQHQEIVPTLYGFSQAQQLVRYNGFPEDQLVQVVGTGSACLLIHRSVFEAIADLKVGDEIAAATGQPADAKRFPPPWPWYAETISGANWGDSISEDLTFCIRAAQAGFPIFVDTSIEIGHVKPVVIDKEAFFRALPDEEAPAPTFVVIPVKGQHEYTNAIVEQLVAQGGFDHLWIFDNASDSDPYVPEIEGDTITVVPAEGKSIYAMWNMGVRNALSTSQRCNIAILNNDLILGDEFLTNLAQGLRAHPSVAAVSANYDNREFVEKVQAVKGIAAGREDGTGGLAGFAFMVRGEIFTAGCPMFDEENFTLWYGDNDFTNNLDKAEAVYGIVRDAHVVHIDGGSKTSGDGKGKRLTPELQAVVEQDRKNYEAKWG